MPNFSRAYQIQKGNKLNKITILLLMLITIISACKPNNELQIDFNPDDPHSYSNFHEVIVKHVDFDLNVDFGKKQIFGEASYKIENLTNSKKIIFDTKKLNIKKVTINESEEPTKFELGKYDSVFGQPLVVHIEPETKIVNITYTTSKDADALQWLEPENTTDGKQPFLFSDSQPIMGRSWYPIQDNPGVRQTYTVNLKTQPGLMAIMSGKNAKEKSEDGTYKIVMEQPIPSYLIAIAVGDFEYQSLGPRSGIYAESSIIEKAAYEFGEVEEFMDAAERLYGPYRWDDYNIVIMPRSYPMGGMENPRINFYTPTVISGDRTLLSLLAHELAHSWSGNLVTNANWNDLWINEGFTSYLEHRIMEEVYGREYQQMLAQLDQQNLHHVLGRLKGREHLTKLHLNLSGIDPEGNSGLVAYEKGTFFLTLIEETIGREKLDKFLRKYFDNYAFETMTSQKFLAYLREHLIKGDQELEKKLKLDEWVYGTGVPDNMIIVKSPEFEKVDNELNKWKSGTSATNLNVKGWTTHHWLHFIRGLDWDMNESQLTDLDKAFDFTNSGNNEILHAWLLRVVHNKYQPAYFKLEEFLSTIGRRKFLRPLYNKLAETPENFEVGKQLYNQYGFIYHNTARMVIDEIFERTSF